MPQNIIQPFLSVAAPVLGLAPTVAIVGGGLAGCECALSLARAGVASILYEQKPASFSPAHGSADLAELVCSNSFRSNDPESSGVGLLKEEMTRLGSRVLEAACMHSVPAGKALAVDRELFSRQLTEWIEADPLISLQRTRIDSLFDPALAGKIVVLAAGPLASENLVSSLQEALGKSGESSLYFYDAIAPIVAGESIDMKIAFVGSRYDAPGSEAGDYLNCPMNRTEYETFYKALLEAEKVPSREFEKELHFEGCMPIEAMAERGEKTLTFGPLKPIGFTDPRTGKRPYALVQLRAENLNRSAFNLVGCQTKMTFSMQDKVFRLIPGLAQVEFLRHGSMHRNTYVNAPHILRDDCSLRAMPGIYLAGQICGVEGYVESAASGLWLGLHLAAKLHERELPLPPVATALGALLNHLRTPAKHFQPSNINFGLMPEIDPTGLKKTPKKMRRELMVERARREFDNWLLNYTKMC